jgi:hypothetical protein
MLNPILPTATGGADPELDGRVDALESDFSDLADRTTAVQDFQNAVSMAIGGFTAPYLYGMSGYWLSYDLPVSKFNSTLGRVEFSVNDQVASFEVEAEDTLNEITNKFMMAASEHGFYGAMQIFAGQIRIPLYDGFKISFPSTHSDYRHIWSVLGLSNLTRQSVQIDEPNAIIANRVWMDTSPETVNDNLQRVQYEVDILNNVITMLGGIETDQNPSILNTAYMYPDLFGINLLTEETNLGQYGVTATSTFDINVDGQQYSIPAGSSLRVRDVVDQLNLAGMPDVGFDVYGGFVRVIVRSWDGLNHTVELGSSELNGIFGLTFQTLNYIGKVAPGTSTMTQKTVHYDVANGNWELLQTIIERQNREISMLQQVVSGLIAKVDGGA